MLSIPPVLSICVPSRNRQKYFQQTIKGLVASTRDDVEFVFIDNSDDPSVMDNFITPYLSDRRVKYVPSGEKVRSMIENWEVGARVTSGRWVTFIGDDDFMDPEAAGLFRRIEATDPNIDAIDWAKISYFWPDDSRKPVVQSIPLQTDIHRVPRSLLMARTFQWESAKQVLMSGFSIYHGAVSRRLLDRIRQRYSGRFFEHPVVDYDSLMKNIIHGENFIHITRPLSVLGVCPLSNTAALGNRERSDKAQKEFHKEHAIPMDDWECYRDYPFRTRHGVTACIGMVHHWLSKTYGYNFTGYEANFAQACAQQCNQSQDYEQYKLYVEAYRGAFRSWKGGKYFKYFKPEFKKTADAAPFTGYHDAHLYVMERTPWSETATEFYRLVDGFLTPLDTISTDLDSRIVDTARSVNMKQAAGMGR